MNKQVLNEFIKKYYLGGMLEKTTWVLDGGISTRFMTADQVLIGEVRLPIFETDITTEDTPVQLAVLNTKQLMRMLDVLGSEIKVSLNKDKTSNRNISLEFSDTNTSINYVLADLAVIKTPPNIKSGIEPSMTMNMDSDTRAVFIKAATALEDEKTFSISTPSEGTCKISIGHQDINSNRINITCNATGTLQNAWTFKAEYLKQVILANQASQAIPSISVMESNQKAMLVVTYSSDEYSAKYYIAKDA